MIDQIEISNYRCLRHVEASLKPLTVLIGANDSGKSTFLGAVSSLLQKQTEFQPQDFWQHDLSNDITISGCTKSGSLLTRSLKRGERLQPQENEDQTRSSLLPMQRFQLPAAGVPMRCSGYGENEERTLPVSADGQGVPALLDFLLRRDRRRFFAIVEALQREIPGLIDIEISTPRADHRQVNFVMEGDLVVNADAASAGVRMLLFFVSLAYHPIPPKTILLEEPETGIHPKRLSNVMRLLQDLTLGKHGDHPSQVIVTTHSPYLLDSVDLERDQILVFRRESDGSRDAQAIDAERLKNFLDEFMLGEIWFNEEEAGLVAKP